MNYKETNVANYTWYSQKRLFFKLFNILVMLCLEFSKLEILPYTIMWICYPSSCKVAINEKIPTHTYNATTNVSPWTARSHIVYYLPSTSYIKVEKSFTKARHFYLNQIWTEIEIWNLAFKSSISRPVHVHLSRFYPIFIQALSG